MSDFANSPPIEHMMRPHRHMPAKRLRSCLGILLVTIAFASLAGPPEKIRLSDLHQPAGGMQGELEFQKDINVTPEIKIPLRIDVTAKGNGLLRIANLKLKVFDDHNDGVYYEGGLLDIDFCDMDGDGKKAIVISGIICFTDEKGKLVIRREIGVWIYKLQSDLQYREVYAKTAFRLD